MQKRFGRRMRRRLGRGCGAVQTEFRTNKKKGEGETHLALGLLYLRVVHWLPLLPVPRHPLLGLLRLSHHPQ